MRHLHYTHNLDGEPPPPVVKPSKKGPTAAKVLSVLTTKEKQDFLLLTAAVHRVQGVDCCRGFHGLLQCSAAGNAGGETKVENISAVCSCVEKRSQPSSSSAAAAS